MVQPSMNSLFFVAACALLSASALSSPSLPRVSALLSAIELLPAPPAPELNTASASSIMSIHLHRLRPRRQIIGPRLLLLSVLMYRTLPNGYEAQPCGCEGGFGRVDGTSSFTASAWFASTRLVVERVAIGCSVPALPHSFFIEALCRQLRGWLCSAAR